MRGAPVVRRALCGALLAVACALSIGSTVGAQTGRTTTTQAPATTTTAVPTTLEAPEPSVDAGTSESVTTKGEVDDPAQKRLRWIIAALIALAVVILGITIWFWRATRPAKVGAPAPAPSGIKVTDVTESAPLPRRPVGARVDSVRIPSRPVPVPPGYRAPIWADEQPPARPTRPAASRDSDPRVT